jgi:predicted nucleic acid-binding protein
VRVAFDAVMLSAYLHPGAKHPKPIDRVPDRIQALVDELQAAGAKIVVPTPVLSEFLVLAGNDGPTYLSELTTTDVFDIQPFDTLAAVEAAAAQRKALDEGDKKSGTTARWQVVKVDRQFVAVAKVHGVSVVYSDDDGVKRLAEEAGMQVRGVADLPVPPPDTPSLFPAS